MTQTRDAVNARGETTRAGVSLSWDDPDWAKEAKPARDWKKLLLVAGLGALSWVATYVGMLELIEANMGELPIVHKVIIGFSVAMLMTMIVWLLDQMFSPVAGWCTRTCYAAGYIFLSVISVGFGFGFYWKVLESKSVASTSAEAAVTQVQTSLFAASTRLEQLQATLEQLVGVSKQKAETERANGTSCPSSKPGEGPRRRMRDEDAARFGFAGDFVKGRVGSVKSELSALDVDLLKIATNDASIVDARSGTRNEFMKGLTRKLEMTVTGFNTFRSDPQLKQIRAELAERADKSSFADGKGGTFLCPDTQLQSALKGVVRAIDELPVLEKPKIATVEGSEAVIEAFRRLTATFYGALAFKLPPSAEELRELQKKAIEQAEGNGLKRPVIVNMDLAGLSKRDYIPLAIAIFVDICLLLVSIGRPSNRLQGLVPKMRAAERGPVIQILSRFNQIHRDAEIRENFEIFRHVVFDFNGDYYVAVPLDAPARMNPAQREELRLEASLLANLFSSFEKEKIFSRVLLPLLPLTSIRKKLRRQGSKFAEAEAFRIYKFKDGAWSEIILGAIMGAARRVEADQRRRRVEEEIFYSETPMLTETSRRGGSRRAATAPARDDASPPSEAPDAPRHMQEALASFSGQRRGTEPAYRTPLRPAATGRQQASAEPAMTAAHTQQFGPYARHFRPHPAVPAEETTVAAMPMAGRTAAAVVARPADATAVQAGEIERMAEPANSNTGPSARRDSAEPLPQGMAEPNSIAPSNVIPLSAPSAPPGATPPVERATPPPLPGTAFMTVPASEPSVTVEAVERKVTYSVPLGDALLPATVASLAGRAAPPPQLESAATARSPDGLPAPLQLDNPEVLAEADILRTARKFRPQGAAE